MSWLDDAKKRCYEVSPGPWMEPPEKVYDIINVDAPRAYALLTGAKAIAQAVELGHPSPEWLTVRCRDLLRDLEGKEPPA